MSGGRYNYNQNTIKDIIEIIESEIEQSGKAKTKEELREFARYRDAEWYNKYPEDIFHYKYSNEVIKEFKKGAKALKIAYIYAQRIDWLLSGDDGEETFLDRLKNELNALKINPKNND
jgi:hypothetical protein